jgi:potassium efflux system protein
MLRHWHRIRIHELAAIAIALFLVSIAAVSQVQAQQQSTGARSQDTGEPAAVTSIDVPASVKRQASEIDTISKQIGQLRSASDERMVPSYRMGPWTETLERVRRRLQEIVAELTPRLNDSKAKFERLGPPPKDGIVESPELAAQRKTLTGEVAAYDGLIKRAEILFVQAGQVLGRLAELRRERFKRRLLEQTDSLATADYWLQTLQDVPRHVEQAGQSATRWLQEKLGAYGWSLLAALLSAAFVGACTSVLLSKMVRSLTIDGQASLPERPNRSLRGTRVLWRALRRALPLAAASSALVGVGAALGVFVQSEIEVLAKLVAYVSISAFLIAAISTALDPGGGDKRLVSIDRRSASWIRVLLTAGILVWCVDQVLSVLEDVLLAPFHIVTLHLAVAAFLYAGMTSALAMVRIGSETAGNETSRIRGWAPWLFSALVIVSGVTVVSLLLGYVQLSRFVGSQFIATGGLLLIVTLIHLTAEFVSTRTIQIGKSQNAGATVDSTVMSATLGVIVGIVLDLVVLVVGIPLLLLQWGYEWNSVRDWMQTAFLGFQVGGVRVSLGTLFTATAILFAGIIATLLIRRMLIRRLRPVLVNDGGAVDSIAAILSYGGFIGAVLVALSYLGVSLSNLLLVAGALSVGIGFGLQSIANNFISGLILLMERPIKVGDWIVLGDQQGRVQKISVRSTEIRTFDRSTLIVPNADLITGRVVNWTHGDTLGRVIIPVGVSYSADPRKVLELLLKVAQDCKLTLDHPKPIVVFEGFGDSSLDFTLRTYIRDISDGLAVQTELRVAIFEALRSNNIEIPFPQRDVHIQSSEDKLAYPRLVERRSSS